MLIAILYNEIHMCYNNIKMHFKLYFLKLLNVVFRLYAAEYLSLLTDYFSKL